MIYTVTLNPGLDRVLWTKEELKEGIPNRALDDKTLIGGKGIGVSRTLASLGVKSTVFGFAGGFSGDMLKEHLEEEKNIKVDFTKIKGDTRINVTIYKMNSEKPIQINTSGPKIDSKECDDLLCKIRSLSNPEIITIGGSLPQGMEPEIYRKIMKIAKQKKAKIILDVDGPALKMCIDSKPNIIKPNVHELSDFVGHELRGIDEIAEAARNIYDYGIDIVLVSMDAKGMLMIANGEEYLAEPPQVTVTNVLGTGDSSIAGFIYGMLNGKDLKDSLICAVAAGTAATLSDGKILCSKEDFMKVIPQIKISSLAKQRPASSSWAFSRGLTSFKRK
jgi:1-phosphofructokinase family hexose kinase